MKTGIHINNLSVTLADSGILTSVSCHLTSGELVALVGPNGAGKSTLIRAALGLLTTETGDITFDGTDIADLTPKERSKFVAYAPQGAPVHWPMEVEHIVGLGRIPHLNPWGRIGEEDQAVIDRALKNTETDHLKGRLVTTLSGGERARVMLARAMVANAPYLLADEPIASLDPYHQIQIMDILKAEAARGAGVMVVLHDLSLAQRYADRVVLLHEGKVLADGAPDHVLSDVNLKKAFQIDVARFTDEGEAFIIPR